MDPRTPSRSPARRIASRRSPHGTRAVASVYLLSLVAATPALAQDDPFAAPVEGAAETEGEAAPAPDEGTPLEPTTAPEPEPPSTAPDTDIAPLNLCALAGKRASAAFQRQRVVMLDAAPDPSFASGPEVELIERSGKDAEVARSVFRTIHPFEHAREVLMSVLPMKRFYLVLASATPGAGFEDKAPIALAEAQQLLSDDPFAAYSAACADWLIAPYMSRGKVVWSQREREKTVVDSNGNARKVKYQAWALSVPLQVRAEVYRRQGDGFVHHATLQATPRGTAADEALNWGNPHEVHETVSLRPPPGCAVPGAPDTRADLFASCGGMWWDLSPEGASPTLGGGMRASRYCQNLDDSVRSDQRNMPALARCELRVAAEYLAVDLQLKLKQMCGMRLFSPLLDVEGRQERGISMGEHEGTERGAVFMAHAQTGDDGCGDSDDIGWARVSEVGPGGEAGFQRPSILRFQAGNPPSGVRMEEYALHGLRFALRPTAALLLAKGELESSVAFGPSFQAGYDLTRFVPLFDELWIEGNVGLLFGSETFLPLGVGFEGASYVGDRLSLIGGLGFALTSASKSVEVGQTSISFSGSASGVQARAGMNYAIRPNWHARLMAELRSGFGSTQLEAEEAPLTSFDAGTLTMALLQLSLSYTY